MKYGVVAVFLLLSVSCRSEDTKQNLTKTQDAVPKQNPVTPEPTEHKPIDNTNNSKPAAQEHDTVAKSNSTTNETVLSNGTEAPVIIDGSTFHVPGTEIVGNNTVPPPTTTAPVTTTTTTITPITTSKPTSVPPTTAPNVTVPTTQEPQPASSTPSPTHQRGFDGPSFVGGIVLALGLVAIGFVAFKFYKARTELNYHTL